MLTDDDLIIMPSDLRLVRKGTNTGYCRPGLERWASTYGLSLKAFMRNGIPAARLKGIDDPFLEKVLEVARARAALQGEGK